MFDPMRCAWEQRKALASWLLDRTGFTRAILRAAIAPGVEATATRRRNPVPVKPPSDGVQRRAPKSQGQRLSRPQGQGESSGEDAADCSLGEHIGEVSEDLCPKGVVMRVPLVRATADDTPIYDQLRVDVEFWSIVGPPSGTGGGSDE